MRCRRNARSGPWPLCKPYTFAAPPVNPDPGQYDRGAAKAIWHWHQWLLQPADAPDGQRGAKPQHRMPHARAHGAARHRTGQPFEPPIDPASRGGALRMCPRSRSRKMVAKWDSLGKDVNGWRLPPSAAATAPTILSAAPGPLQASHRSCPTSRCIPPPRWTARAASSTAPTITP